MPSNVNVAKLFRIQKCTYSVKCSVRPDENVLNGINNNVIHPRRHPGRVLPKSVITPESFIKAAVNVLRDYPIKALVQASESMNRHLKGRNAPTETDAYKEVAQKLQERVIAKHSDYEIKTKEDEIKFKQMVKDKTMNLLREKVYNWKPMKYDSQNSLVYLLGRSSAEYAVLVRILGEIQARDPDFKPRSFFDFGSGTGTAIWAANTYWKKNIFEYYNVDVSRDMNDLSQLLLQGGIPTGSMPKGVFYRQFMPANNTMYDLVVSAYTMFEMPSAHDRLQAVLNLWNKTEKYLVIIEQGTNAGFKIINELRDFILQIKKDNSKGHVFSPCPHDQACPRFLLDDGTPCNFEVKYFSLPIGAISQQKMELYSYVVLKKGSRNEEEPKWPRLVRPTLVRSKHSICRMCNANGQLREVIFTASKHTKPVYHCARASIWGDRLPMEIDDCVDSSEDVDIICDDNT
ncbi:unnamed protein product [Callosobruchus maculatus]|uniref:Methyltransferase-like protein 17, mitochondrial n=1 Tax=Callosobruchus maculatus TaxID=64391 RepID=A0A653C0Y3_CALMS|nr:unnamed protein product [Callosobruchus maculatus]